MDLKFFNCGVYLPNAVEKCRQQLCKSFGCVRVHHFGHRFFEPDVHLKPFWHVWRNVFLLCQLTLWTVTWLGLKPFEHKRFLDGASSELGCLAHSVSPLHPHGAGDGTTLLHLACGVGLSDLALRVLERRADVALEHRYFGAPLMLAAERGAGNEVWGFWRDFTGGEKNS